MGDRPSYLTEEEWAKVCTANAAREREEQERSPEFSEDRLALRFTERHGKDLRYVAAWRKWLAWTGTHWEIENTLAVFDMARKICRDAAGVCKQTEAKSLSKAKVVAAVETLARTDRRIAATVVQWNPDEFFFNTGKGKNECRSQNRH